MTSTAQTAPRGGNTRSAADVFFARRDGATAWRRDNAESPFRDVAWRSYRTGALWTVRHPKQAEQRRTLERALSAAERAVPFGP